MTAMVQWEAVAGVTHAWIAQCEGYVSLCGREVSGFGGQRSGIRCGLCATSAGWAEATGESSYWTPQGPMIVEPQAPTRVGHRHMAPRPPRAPRAIRQVILAPVVIGREPPTRPEAPPLPTTMPIVEGSGGLTPPDSGEVYRALPEAEQRYWAPVMLARAGQDAVWDQAQETAEQFQSRCYEQLVR